jgi:hypothetical protein
MYKQILRSIADVGVFGSISLILFFTVFCLVLIRVVMTKKNYIEKMSNLPLDITN